MRIQQLLQFCVDQWGCPARDTRYDDPSTVATGSGFACGACIATLEYGFHFCHACGRREGFNESWRSWVVLEVEQIRREDVGFTEYPSLDEDLVDAERRTTRYCDGSSIQATTIPFQGNEDTNY